MMDRDGAEDLNKIKRSVKEKHRLQPATLWQVLTTLWC